MSAADDFDLDQAYAVETPEDNRRLYAAWADSYDSGFLDTHGYVYHESVVAALLGRRRPHGPVADIGCGTGIVGIELRRQGIDVVDGIDLSPEMLAVAGSKRHGDDPVYRHLIEADLTVGVDMPAAAYAAVVSAGTFTHGHLGPEPIAELVRIASPGAPFAIGVNEDHFATAGFEAWFANAVETGAITDFEIVNGRIYDAERYVAEDVDEHANTLASIAMFSKAGA